MSVVVFGRWPGPMPPRLSAAVRSDGMRLWSILVVSRCLQRCSMRTSARLVYGGRREQTSATLRSLVEPPVAYGLEKNLPSGGVMLPRISLVPGTVRKVCQLTGELDRERNELAFNRTQSRFGVVGTDLGSSFEHNGRLWFLFGDTWPDSNLADSVAWTTDPDSEPGINLTFIHDGERFRSPRVSVSGGFLSTGAFEVPIAGQSIPQSLRPFILRWPLRRPVPLNQSGCPRAIDREGVRGGGHDLYTPAILVCLTPGHPSIGAPMQADLVVACPPVTVATLEATGLMARSATRSLFT